MPASAGKNTVVGWCVRSAIFPPYILHIDSWVRVVSPGQRVVFYVLKLHSHSIACEFKSAPDVAGPWFSSEFGLQSETSRRPSLSRTLFGLQNMSIFEKTPFSKDPFFFFFRSPTITIPNLGAVLDFLFGDRQSAIHLWCRSGRGHCRKISANFRDFPQNFRTLPFLTQ